MSCDVMTPTMDDMTTTPQQEKGQAVYGTTFFGVDRSQLPAAPAGPKAHRRTRTASWIVAASLGVLASGTLSASAGATGLLPPANPSANIAPSSSDWLTSIDAASAAEGVAPMPLSEATFDALAVPEQIFTVVNQERLDRGLAPIQYMTAQLNADALGGANAQTDPSFPASLTGGAPLTGGGAIWGGGVTSVLEMDYYWMYDDGWGGSAATTSNEACAAASSSGCWGHRDVILHAFSACAGGVAPTLSMGAAYSATGGGSMAAVLVSTCGAPPADVTLSWSQMQTQGITQQKVIGVASLSSGLGYWAASSNGAVTAHGSAANLGSMAGQSLNSPIVGIAATPDGGGFWLVAADGGIFSFGDAKFYGSTGALRLNKPIVGMASSPNGGGYWLVASDGGIFSFGDASFYGSMGAKALNEPIVGMAADQATGGYWLVASDGGIFSFDASFFGSTGALRLNKPIVGMEALGNGEGYRFVASDGGVFCFGQAAFDGSAGAQTLPAAVSGMAPDQATGGYWLAGAGGVMYSFGAPVL
jgi:hypothetical protein